MRLKCNYTVRKGWVPLDCVVFVFLVIPYGYDNALALWSSNHCWGQGKELFFYTKKRALVNSVLTVRSLSPGPTAREHEESKWPLLSFPGKEMSRQVESLLSLRDDAD